MIHPIVLYGNPALREKAKPIDTFNESLEILGQEMLETMYAGEGIGLAANQIGKPIQLIVVDPSFKKDPSQVFILVNPKIIQSSGSEEGEEGCLSLPGIRVKVARPTKILVEAQDVKGNPITIPAENLLARVLCHEIDHLHGILIIDYLKGYQRRSILKQLEEAVATG